MRLTQRQKLAEKRAKHCLKVLLEKGKEFSMSNDANSNFKGLAAKSGVTKYQAWIFEFHKHYDAISTAIKNDPYKPKFDDKHLTHAVNFLLILESLLKEDK